MSFCASPNRKRKRAVAARLRLRFGGDLARGKLCMLTGSQWARFGENYILYNRSIYAIVLAAAKLRCLETLHFYY